MRTRLQSKTKYCLSRQQKCNIVGKNGKWSSGKQTRALNIQYYMIMDPIDKGILEVKYCPTNDMIGDYMMKDLQGTKFTKFQNEKMGCE